MRKNICVKASREPLPVLHGDRGRISHPKTTVPSEIVIISKPSLFDARPHCIFCPQGLCFLIKLYFRIYEKNLSSLGHTSSTV